MLLLPAYRARRVMAQRLRLAIIKSEGVGCGLWYPMLTLHLNLLEMRLAIMSTEGFGCAFASLSLDSYFICKQFTSLCISRMCLRLTWIVSVLKIPCVKGVKLVAGWSKRFHSGAAAPR